MRTAAAERALAAIVDRVDVILANTGDRFPYVNVDGTWETTADGNWCGGHWIGLLRLAAAHDDDRVDRFSAAADAQTAAMVTGMERSSMFCGMNFHYAGFRAYDRTGDRSHFGRGLAGADAMCELFHDGARQVSLGILDIKGPEQFRGPATAHGPTGERLGAVDAIYVALGVLWRAYRETRRPHFRDIAISHADRHLDWYHRDDGSTWHHAEFDADGSLVRQYNELAASDATCWARGLGWHVAGLVRCYNETGAERYLAALEASVAYHRANTPGDEIPYWDYAAPEIPDEPRDTSAAGLIAYGLTALEPADDAHATRVAPLRAYGRELLAEIVDGYMILDADANRRGAVLQGCFNAPGDYATNAELIWTNYYVARALERVVTEGHGS